MSSDPPAHPLRRLGWIAGLPLLALVWGGTTFVAAPGIAARIAFEGDAVARTTQELGGEPWLRVEANGRDLVARGEAPGEAERSAALTRLAELPGPRRVVPDIGLVETAAPFAWTLTRTDDRTVAGAGSRPAEIGRHALEGQIAAALPPGLVLDDAARAARGAPPDFATAAAWAASRLGQLGAGGRVSVTDTVIAAAGEALDVPAYDALRNAFADPPRGYSIGRIDILPPAVADYRFAVERVAGGGLVLTGYTVSETGRAEIRRRAAEAAAGAFVDDRTRTARGLPPGIDPGALAGTMLDIADLIQRGRVAFEGGRISVAGDAIDGQASGEIAALMRDRLPAGVGAGAVALAVQPLSPYRVSIRREADSVSLGGHLPDAAARERVLAAIRPRFFRERILDRTRLAEGAPPGLVATLEALVPTLSTLAQGEVAVADRSLSLTGESLYRESAARLAATVPRLLPPDWTARVAVQARGAPEARAPEACRTEFAAAPLDGRIRFAPGSVALTPEMYPLLDAAAALARACPALRFAVAGHTDPPGQKAAKAEEAKPEEAKPEGAKPAEAAPDAAKAPGKDAGKDAGKPQKPAKAPERKEAKGAPKAARPAPAPEPEPSGEDLARLRAQAIVEYLLQAGAGLDQVAVAEEPAGERRAVALALRP